MIGRSFVILLAVATAVSFLPMMGDAGVYAAEGENGAETYYALPGQEGDASGFIAEGDALTKDELKTELQEQGGAAGIAETPVEAVLQEEPAPDENAANGQKEAATGTEGLSRCGLSRDETGLRTMGEEGDVDGDDEGETPPEEPSGTPPEEPPEEPPAEVNPDGVMSVSVNNSGIATLSATMVTPDVYFTEVWVDDSWVTDVNRETNIAAVTFDMKRFPVGFHTVKLFLGSDVYEKIEDEGWFMFYDHVPTSIFKKPTLRLADFYTGCSYFIYKDNYNSYSYDSDCGVYFDYKRAGKKWSNGWGPISSGANVKRAKLVAASKYYVHTYYAKKTYYTPPKRVDAETDPVTETKVFKGPMTKNVGFKTAYKKPPVKFIKAKKIKQWCKKYKVRRLSSKIYWRNGYAGWGWYRKVLGTKTYKYWYTKVKITVTMKKKPGVAGIQIGEKIVKGNKKTYSAKFTLAGKKKGKKIKVSVYSYMSTKYGGWSGKTLKKVKVK